MCLYMYVCVNITFLTTLGENTGQITTNDGG